MLLHLSPERKRMPRGWWPATSMALCDPPQIQKILIAADAAEEAEVRLRVAFAAETIETSLELE